MSNDLISRKATIEVVKMVIQAGLPEEAIYAKIEEIPASFDKEKVIEELKGQIELVSYNPMTAGRYIKKDRVIKIVEKGGIE